MSFTIAMFNNHGSSLKGTRGFGSCGHPPNSKNNYTPQNKSNKNSGSSTSQSFKGQTQSSSSRGRGRGNI